MESGKNSRISIITAEFDCRILEYNASPRAAKYTRIRRPVEVDRNEWEKDVI